MFGIGPWELGLVLLILVVVFGGSRLPQLGTGIGEGIRNFKKSYRDSKALDVSPEEKKTEES